MSTSKDLRFDTTACSTGRVPAVNKTLAHNWVPTEEATPSDDMKDLLRFKSSLSVGESDFSSLKGGLVNRQAMSSLILAAAALGVPALPAGPWRSYGSPRPSVGAFRKTAARRRAKQSQKKARKRNRK